MNAALRCFERHFDVERVHIGSYILSWSIMIVVRMDYHYLHIRLLLIRLLLIQLLMWQCVHIIALCSLIVGLCSSNVISFYCYFDHFDFYKYFRFYWMFINTMILSRARTGSKVQSWPVKTWWELWDVFKITLIQLSTDNIAKRFLNRISAWKCWSNLYFKLVQRTRLIRWSFVRNYYDSTLLEKDLLGTLLWTYGKGNFWTWYLKSRKLPVLLWD